MIKKIKSILLTFASIAMIGAPLGLPAMAAADTIPQSLCTGTNLATSNGSGNSCTAGASTSNLGTFAGKVVNLLSLIVGVVAVVMIIVGGFRYITSGGESGSVSGAKNTLIYAIVGLVIVALAQFIVHFVLTNVPSTG